MKASKFFVKEKDDIKFFLVINEEEHTVKYGVVGGMVYQYNFKDLSELPEKIRILLEMDDVSFVYFDIEKFFNKQE